MAEAVGFVLAVIPLVVSATKHFTTAKSCISRYRKFSEDVQEFVAALNTQATIFRSATQLLLMSYVGEEKSVQMINDHGHPGWTDADIEDYLCKRFSTCLSGLMDALSLLSNRLVSLQKMTQGWNEIVVEVEQNKSLSASKRIRRIGKRINFACSKGRIENLLVSLKSRTQDYQTLIQQTERMQESRCSSEPSPFAQSKVAKLVAVKGAAENLYEAFGQACTKHTEHQAHLSLQPAHNDPSQVRFLLAFKQMTLQPATNNAHSLLAREPLWLTVESAISGTIEPNSGSGVHGVLQGLQSIQKRCRESTPPDDRKEDIENVKRKAKKTVAFNLPSSSTLAFSSQSPSFGDDTATDPLPNLCTAHNFCNQLQKVLSLPASTKNRCIGYLNHSGKSRHLVYIDSRMDSVTQGLQASTMKPLSLLLTKAYRQTLPGALLLQYERIRLAKQLATAVLQFHATQWLKESWRSDDVLISGADQLGTSVAGDSLENPYASYVSVSIKGSQPQQSLVSTSMGWTPIRNRLMFSLGKMLLELAFHQPFQSLRKEEDVDMNDQELIIDWFTANRLLHQVSTELGLRYAELVRKCILCDFAQGFDLNKTRLQESFYQHVIYELELCERQALGLSSH